jgi:ribonuclease D
MPVITDSVELKNRIDALKSETFVTIDTEFLREKTYFPLLCLVQIAGEKDFFAIDPLADGIDLTPMWDLLEDENVIKVFHACQQDVEIVLHATGKIPTQLFDSQIAAQVLGFGESIGYGNLVTKICKIELDKSSRHTDWSARPLSPKQIEYALSDVTHLRKIYVELKRKLEERERTSWFNEEMEKLNHTSVYLSDPEEAWKKLKVKGGNSKYLGILKELSKWRELRAQQVDKPRNWVIKNDGILEIASIIPKKLSDLDGLRFFKSSNTEMRQEILDAVQAGQDNEPPYFEKKKPLPKGATPLIDLLKVLLKPQCDHHDIAPSVVAVVSDLESIATTHNLQKDDPNIPAMQGWRYEIFGRLALSLKQGDLAMTVESGTITLIKPKYE